MLNRQFADDVVPVHQCRTDNVDVIAAAKALASTTGFDADVIIIGAGFGGLGMAMRLQKLHVASFIVLERSGEIGGTWRDNVYPGCACDIPAMLYSFSFASSVDWTSIYPRQAEILAYLKRCAARNGLDKHVRFNSEVAQARFDEARRGWEVTLKDGLTLRSRVIVSACGPLNKPNIPQIAGAQSFAGSAFHSSVWNYDIDLNGKNVVVIGTGASAIQFVPHVAAQAKQLVVFQRTAAWVIPRNDKRIGQRRRNVRKFVPFYAWLVRKAIYWMLEIRALGFVYFPQLLQRSEADILRFLEHAVRDPALRTTLTPAYRAGCKRILISDDFYPAIQRPNVELITQGVAEIRPHSVVTVDGREVSADVIIYGTGFKATDGIAPLRISGSGGTELDATWRDGMQAYLGTTVTRFPNLFFVIGPNTGLGHNSMVLMMEAQYRYIEGALRFLKRKKGRTIDVKPDVMRSFNATLQDRLQRTVWATGCASWYQDARGKNVSLWPGFTFMFRRLTARFDPTRYQVVDTADTVDRSQSRK